MKGRIINIKARSVVIGADNSNLYDIPIERLNYESPAVRDRVEIIEVSEGVTIALEARAADAMNEQNTCPICGSQLSMLAQAGNAVSCRDGIICGRCYKMHFANFCEYSKNHRPEWLTRIKEMSAGESIDFLQSMYEQKEKDEKAILRGFKCTYKVYRPVQFDDNHKLVLLEDPWDSRPITHSKRNIANTPLDKSKCLVLDYKQIIGAEVIENDTTITAGKGAIANAVIGAAIAGKKGAAAGVATKVRVPGCHNLAIKLTVKGFSEPAIFINFINSAVEKNTQEFKAIFANMQTILSQFQKIINYNQSAKPVRKDSSVKDPTDEIRKYKALLDDGIITNEEFELKKNELLWAKVEAVREVEEEYFQGNPYRGALVEEEPKQVHPMQKYVGMRMSASKPLSKKAIITITCILLLVVVPVISNLATEPHLTNYSGENAGVAGKTSESKVEVADFLGMSVSDIYNRYGNDYSVDSWQGGTYIYYEGVPYCFYFGDAGEPNGYKPDANDKVYALEAAGEGTAVVEGIKIGDSLSSVENVLGVKFEVYDEDYSLDRPPYGVEYLYDDDDYGNCRSAVCEINGHTYNLIFEIDDNTLYWVQVW